MAPQAVVPRRSVPNWNMSPGPRAMGDNLSEEDPFDSVSPAASQDEEERERQRLRWRHGRWTAMMDEWCVCARWTMRVGKHVRAALTC
jgi:hypothetical protein